MLSIAEAKRHLFPVTKINKKGEEVTRWIPGGYGITLSDGHHVSVTSRKRIVGQTEEGQTIQASHRFVSVKAPPTPVLNCFGQVIGKEDKGKVVFPCSSWAKFVAEYQRCGMPALVEQGMIQADIELEERRQAGRAA